MGKLIKLIMISKWKWKWIPSGIMISGYTRFKLDRSKVTWITFAHSNSYNVILSYTCTCCINSIFWILFWTWWFNNFINRLYHTWFLTSRIINADRTINRTFNKSVTFKTIWFEMPSVEIQIIWKRFNNTETEVIKIWKSPPIRISELLQVKRATVMLVTLWCWWLTVGGNLRVLATE